jgi:hypothetical protein
MILIRRVICIRLVLGIEKEGLVRFRTALFGKFLSF